MPDSERRTPSQPDRRCELLPRIPIWNRSHRGAEDVDFAHFRVVYCAFLSRWKTHVIFSGRRSAAFGKVVENSAA